MSKNIVIQEGGIGKQLTADKLKTNLVGGGICLWVSEDMIARLGTKNITQNGTYKADADGYDGYSEVTVSGIGKTTGRDPDTGIEYTYGTDEDGEITREETSNMLDLGPITSISSASSGTVSSEDHIRHYRFDSGSGKFTNILRTAYLAIHIWATESPGAIAACDYMPTGGHEGPQGTQTFSISSTFTYNQKTVYFKADIGARWTHPIHYASPVCNGGSYIGTGDTSWVGAVAWKMIYGSGDGFGGATGGGGEAGDTGAGRND